MAETHELLEHAENGNYYPHGKFSSKEEAHKYGKSLGFKEHQYTIHSKYGTTERIRKEATDHRKAQESRLAGKGSHDPVYENSKKNK